MMQSTLFKNPQHSGYYNSIFSGLALLQRRVCELQPRAEQSPFTDINTLTADGSRLYFSGPISELSCCTGQNCMHAYEPNII